MKKVLFSGLGAFVLNYLLTWLVPWGWVVDGMIGAFVSAVCLVIYFYHRSTKLVMVVSAWLGLMLGSLLSIVQFYFEGNFSVLVGDWADTIIILLVVLPETVILLFTFVSGYALAGKLQEHRHNKRL